MSSNATKKHSKMLFIYAIAIMMVLTIKVFIIEMIAIGKTDRLLVFETENKPTFKYHEESIQTENEDNYNKPIFEDEYLNSYVDDYLSTNSCTYLEYNVYELDDTKVNIFLNCGNPQNKIYDFQNEVEVNFYSLVKEYDTFVENSKRLLNMKYPTFVTDDVIFEEAIYDIKANELTGYYETNDYGSISIRINNNEIRDLMTYQMDYDDAYENETYQLDPNKKTVAFTFDDGPSSYDLSIIESLVASHSSATFYMVGNRMQSFPASIAKMLETNMEVGNHTYDHKSLTNLSDEQVKEQITKTNTIFYEMTGCNLTTLRPSYGNVNTRVRMQVGLPVILWNIDTLDWKTRNAEKIYESIINDVDDGDIVLMHSLYASTVEAVEKVLPELYKMGFQVVGVEELARLKGYTLNSSSVITNMN